MPTCHVIPLMLDIHPINALMSVEPNIRVATIADSDWLSTCTDEAYGVYISDLGRKPLPMTVDYRAALDDYEIWIVEIEGTRTGLLMLQNEDDHVLIYSVAVLPEFSGHGIDKLLQTHAENIAVKNGFNQLRLYTNELMKYNLALYRRFGYVDTHVTRYKGSNVIHLQKPLAV